MEGVLCSDDSHIDCPTERRLGCQQGKRPVNTLRLFIKMIDTMSLGICLPAGNYLAGGLKPFMQVRVGAGHRKSKQMYVEGQPRAKDSPI